MNKKLKVLCISNNVNSTIFTIRIRTPLELWKKKFRHNVKFVQTNNISEINFSLPDIFILQRKISEINIKIVIFLKKNKKKNNLRD